MSVNKYTNGELVTLSNGTRAWIGTLAAHDAAKQAGTLPTDSLIYITDDDNEFKTDQVIKDSQKVITSGGVYNALKDYIQITEGTTAWGDSGHTFIRADALYPTGWNHTNCVLLQTLFYFRDIEAYGYQDNNSIGTSQCQTNTGGYFIIKSTRSDFIDKSIKFIWLKLI